MQYLQICFYLISLDQYIKRHQRLKHLIAMECCIEKIREWMIRDKLMINDSKTEFILIGTRQQLSK